MAAANGSLSFITNRAIGTKIAAGFTMILLILVVSAVVARYSLERASAAAEDFARLVTNSATFHEIDRVVTQYRGHIREYVYSDVEDTAADAIKDGEALKKLIDTGLGRVTNPERHRLLEEIARHAVSYGAGFERIHQMNLEQHKLQAEVIDVDGPKLTVGISAVAAGAARLANTEVLMLAIDARRLILTVHFNVERRLGRHDEEAAKAAERQFADLRQDLTKLDAATADNRALSALVKGASDLIEPYQAAFRRAAELDAAQLALVNGTLRDEGAEMAEAAVKVKESSLADQARVEQQVLATAAAGASQVTILGFAGLTVGAVLAWLIGRGISGPVVRMCMAMRALAGGDKTTVIPGLGRGDEIGQMAEAVQVFKDNLVETDRLREEQEKIRVSADAERKQGMMRLANEFEAGIKSVVSSVATQSGQMQSSARSMTESARNATRQGDRLWPPPSSRPRPTRPDRRELGGGAVRIGARDRWSRQGNGVVPGSPVRRCRTPIGPTRRWKG